MAAVAYVKITNGQIDQYPYTVGQLRRDNPLTSFPKHLPDEMLAEWGVHAVSLVPAPPYDQRAQWLEQDEQPHFEAGKWLLGWTVKDKTAEEVQQYDDNVAASVRAKRDNLIAETDYLALSDTTLTAEMAAYRQALRDITDHVNFPYLGEADWPVKPI